MTRRDLSANLLEWADPFTEPERLDVPDVEPFFAPDGWIARALGARYRYRESQVEMARLVRQALVEGRVALVEAGTGCGKSFAYLIPLIQAGVPALISTANKTLQTQLWEKDIPALQQVSTRPFTAALLKGRANYVCLFKLREARQQQALPGLEEGVSEVLRRLEQVPSGDVEELRLVGALRDAVTARGHECVGRDCPDQAHCYYEEAKLRAEEADVVVINHALLAASLLRPVLSPRPVVVIDEAHELEKYVVDALRLELDYTMVPGFINDSVVLRHVDDTLRQETVRLNHHLFEQLAERPSASERRWTLNGRLEQGAALADYFSAMRRQLMQAYPPVPGDDESGENVRHQAVADWAGELVDQLRALAEEPPRDQVRYCQEQPGANPLERVLLCREPIEVADFLAETLFKSVKRVICTGATIAVGGQLSYFCRQLGVPREGTIERVIDSPFDYARQALLYTPHGLDPQYGAGEDEYVLRLGREIWRLIQASRGRAFVLCTSTRRMKQLYELISPHLEYACYCQGEGLSRGEILELFQNDAAGAVLFATRSFWEGVDVPGEALSLVVIDKLPFAPHRDPVAQQRQQSIRERGGDPFDEMSLPEAILALKQGVGRLIRSETDRGVIAILDSRINTRRYGQKMIASLPPARQSWRIQDVREFFAL